MKVIFSHSIPFFLAHGGSQTLIESLMAHLTTAGVRVEPERWWDSGQQGDILHYVGRPLGLHVALAHAKGMRVVMTELLDQTTSRTPAALWVQKQMVSLGRYMPRAVTGRLGWDAYAQIDAFVYATPHEWNIAQTVFQAPTARGHVIPHGLEADALQRLRHPADEADYLVSVATIAPRKNTVLLAEAAHAAKVPVLFVGKPYTGTDPYYTRFRALIDDRWVRYAGFVEATVKEDLLRRARGFVLLSQYESGCIAVYEAAAAGLPMLLADRPWARTTYPPTPAIRYTAAPTATRVSHDLRAFYQGAHRSPQPTFAVLSWQDVADEYARVYRAVLGT